MPQRGTRPAEKPRYSTVDNRDLPCLTTTMTALVPAGHTPCTALSARRSNARQTSAAVQGDHRAVSLVFSPPSRPLLQWAAALDNKRFSAPSKRSPVQPIAQLLLLSLPLRLSDPPATLFDPNVALFPASPSFQHSPTFVDRLSCFSLPLHLFHAVLLFESLQPLHLLIPYDTLSGAPSVASSRGLLFYSPARPPSHLTYNFPVTTPIIY